MTRVVRLGGGVGRRGAGAAGLRLVGRKDVGGTAAGATGGAALEVGVPTGGVAEDLDRVEREIHVGVSEDDRGKWRRENLAQNQALLIVFRYDKRRVRMKALCYSSGKSGEPEDAEVFSTSASTSAGLGRYLQDT